MSIIGAGIRVHQTLGPGFLESVYEEAICLELELLKLKYARQLPVSIRYREPIIDEHRLDLLVEDQIVAEHKTGTAFDPIHFAATTLQIKRVRWEWHSRAN